MIKNKVALVFFFFVISHFGYGQEFLSPDAFLGYKLGTRFTQHYKVVEYFKYLSKGFPQKMKIQSYGSTNEGRELLIAVVSSSDNINNINEIQKNNLRLSGQLTDKIGDVSLPTVVWLSYNVHGNEASSTEVAMKLLYDLVSGKNDTLESYLKNVMVIIDPCLNPDGRDRYVNWFNQTVGAHPNSNPNAREHAEPWPGGRTNHYYFDLNRDWVWQSQVETIGRLQLYNEWMPAIHCDFHEQYPNSPYYFAPAAEPFHQVITPWQRECQTIIGKNHALYFDRNGWLYFTREVFDLFYPAYGDTYPLFNGAIGMTYEQAGHSPGGLDIDVNGEHLTLSDRIAHHFTTSVSTIEVASKKSVAINMGLKKYFDEVKLNGSGTYKTFVINAESSRNVKALTTLLEKNDIEYSRLNAAIKIKGYHYLNGLDESYTTQENDILVSTFQPKGNLVRVLFEPNSMLSDSLTYDITSWAIPYSYGLDGYALKKNIQTTDGKPTIVNTLNLSSDLENEYGVLLPYHSFSDVQVLTDLLKSGIKVKFSEKDLVINNKTFAKGTLIITSRDNRGKMNLIKDVCQNHEKEYVIFNSGWMDQGADLGSEKIHSIKNPNVALLAGDLSSANAVGEVWFLFDKEMNFPLTLIDANDININQLKNVDVLIIADGLYKVLNEKDNPIKIWVKQGGKLIVMENAAAQIANADWGVKLKKEDAKDDEKVNVSDLVRYENRERSEISNNIPGAVYKIDIDNSYPLAFGYSDVYFLLKMNSIVFDLNKEVWNVGVLNQQNPIAGFVGNNVKRKINNGAVIVAQDFGDGKVVYFADDPLFRNFWEAGKQMFANAVFLVGQ
jgi:hypothetical protein